MEKTHSARLHLLDLLDPLHPEPSNLFTWTIWAPSADQTTPRAGRTPLPRPPKTPKLARKITCTQGSLTDTASPHPKTV